MALVDHLKRVINKPEKSALVGQINMCLQGLYDCFDRNGRKLGLMTVGGGLADRILDLRI